MFRRNSTAIPITTVASLVAGWYIDEDYTALTQNTLTINAMTIWTSDEIQIWNPAGGTWKTTQKSLYVNTGAFCSGFVYNVETNQMEEHKGTTYYKSNYSDDYFSTTARCNNAVEAYLNLSVSLDSTGNIGFFFVDDTYEIILNLEGKPLFTHYAPF